MSLEKYLGLGKIELFKREIKFLIEILIKTMFYLLINEKCLKKQQKVNQKYKLAIIIIVNGKNKAKWVVARSF